ncbi:hypothetical protein MRX96_037346 [Rhipicephalus microplus]
MAACVLSWTVPRAGREGRWARARFVQSSDGRLLKRKKEKQSNRREPTAIVREGGVDRGATPTARDQNLVSERSASVSEDAARKLRALSSAPRPSEEWEAPNPEVMPDQTFNHDRPSTPHLRPRAKSTPTLAAGDVR